MAVTSTHQFAALYVNTSTLSYVAGDQANGVTQIDMEDSREVLSLQELGTPLIFNQSGTRTITMTVEGRIMPEQSDGNLAARTSFANGSLVQVWLLHTTGPDSGVRYPMICTAINESLPLDGFITFSATFSLQGTPVAF